MELNSDDVRVFADASARLLAVVERMENARSNQAATSTLNINAGGFGLWISTTCCAIMVVVALIGSIYAGFYIQDQNAKITRMQDYLNAIYMQAPQLRPTDVNDHHHHAAAKAERNSINP